MNITDIPDDCLREVFSRLSPYDRVHFAASCTALWNTYRESAIPETFPYFDVHAFRAVFDILDVRFCKYMEMVNDAITCLINDYDPSLAFSLRRGSQSELCMNNPRSWGHSMLTIHTDDICEPLHLHIRLPHNRCVVYDIDRACFYASHEITTEEEIERLIRQNHDRWIALWKEAEALASMYHETLLDACAFLKASFPESVYAVFWRNIVWKGDAEGRFALRVHGFHTPMYSLGVYTGARKELTLLREEEGLLWSIYNCGKRELLLHSSISDTVIQRILGLMVRLPEFAKQEYKVYASEQRLENALQGEKQEDRKTLCEDPSVTQLYGVNNIEIIPWWYSSLGAVVLN